MVEAYDEFLLCVLGQMEKNTDSKELCDCLWFIRSYMQKGEIGKMPLVNDIPSKSPILIRYVISALGAYDEIISIINATSSTRAHYSYCLHQLELKLAESMMYGIAADAVVETLTLFPGVDVAAALIDAGYDLVSAFEMAEEFNRCLI